MDGKKRNRLRKRAEINVKKDSRERGSEGERRKRQRRRKKLSK